MIEQIHEDDGQKQNGNEIKFGSMVVFSNIVSCCACGMQMQFVENDVIFGEDWYHGKCWQKTQEDKQNV